ncbi:MAG: helix-turn-helix domain-containing protein [Treponemataceae bacterium]|nr:helix-turn-helix domain-containing protein [Treponemataceae bacterium]
MEWGRIIDTIEEKTGKSVCKELGIRPQYLSDLRSGKSKNPNSDFVLKLIEAFNLNSNWLLTGEGEMFITDIAESAPLQIIPQEGEEITGIPFYDIDVMAHIAESLDLKEETPAGVLSIPGFKDCIACFPVYGSSMEPKISNGDVIAVSQAVTCDQILWGEIYLVITNAWRVVKTVHPGKTEEYIILRSINPAYAGDTNVKKEDLRALYLVRGVVSRLGM